MTKRIFLITGATKGIGRALTDRLLHDGHHVVGLAREARTTHQEVKERNVICLPCRWEGLANRRKSLPPSRFCYPTKPLL